MPSPYILILGCFDTKGEVFQYLRTQILKAGERVVTMNTGTMGTTDAFPVDIEAETVAQAAGTTLEEIRQRNDTTKKRSIAISMFGNTSACVNQCTDLLEKAGYEVMAFHANGVGGATMEALIREGVFAGVLDVTTTELADELCQGVCSAGPTRLTAAAEMGIPQIVVPSCLDMVNYAEPDTVPPQYRNRQLYSWAPNVTLMRTNQTENRLLGKEIVQKLKGANATIVLPLKGISQIDAEGNIFHNPEVNQALFDSIKENAGKNLKVLEADSHINDQAFSAFLVKKLLQIMDHKS